MNQQMSFCCQLLGFRCSARATQDGLRQVIQEEREMSRSYLIFWMFFCCDSGWPVISCTSCQAVYNYPNKNRGNQCHLLKLLEDIMCSRLSGMITSQVGWPVVQVQHGIPFQLPRPAPGRQWLMILVLGTHSRQRWSFWPLALTWSSPSWGGQLESVSDRIVALFFCISNK